MICIRRKKFEKIINSLIQEYHSRYQKEMMNQIGKVDIEHISRCFANSTSVVNGKLAVEYEYINRLVDFLFQSLEKDFPKIPLNTCREILIRTVEVEYKKLGPTVNTWLIQACMAQQGMIKQYGDGILKRLEETKKNITNRCELSTEKQGQKKWWQDRTNQWIIGVVITILLTVIGWLIALA